MLKIYRRYWKLYNPEHQIVVSDSWKRITDEFPETEGEITTPLTWDYIENFAYHSFELYVAHNKRHTKKGNDRELHCQGLRILKEWKTPDISAWQMVEGYEEIQVSMEELYRFPSDLVIQYLKERGMTACPLK